MSMKLTFILAVSALCLSALCQYLWDPTQIVQFAAANDLYQHYYLRGNDIMCALQSTELGAGKQLLDTRNPPTSESRYSSMIATGHAGFNALTLKWFWRRADLSSLACDFKHHGWEWPLSQVNHLGKKEEWSCKRWIHSDPRSSSPISQQHYWIPDENNPGKDLKFTATGAEYIHAVGPRIALFFKAVTPAEGASANWPVSGPIPGSALPMIRQQSDFLWNDWKLFRRQFTYSKINFCGMVEISDMVTLKLIARVLLTRGMSDLQDWPAMNSGFSTIFDEGRALLAHQCVLFLIQHKKTFGLKYVHGIRVFRGPPRTMGGKTYHYPQMLFELADVPSNMIKPDPAPHWQPGQKQDMPPITNPPPVLPPPMGRAVDERVDRKISYKVSSSVQDDENSVRVYTFYAT